jgi:hypothetical protein
MDHVHEAVGAVATVSPQTSMRSRHLMESLSLYVVLTLLFGLVLTVSSITLRSLMSPNQILMDLGPER